LAAAGARILVTGRSAERGDSLVAEIARLGKGGAVFYRADLSSLTEVRQLAARVTHDTKRLDVLINNAGISWVFDSTRKLSADGYEMHFAVNYLSHYLLTKLLLPLLAKSAPARIINVSSSLQAPIDFADPLMEHGYNGMRGYGQSKLAQVMMTFDLAPELEKQGVAIYALHPASIMATNMVKNLGIAPRSTVAEGVESVLNAVVTTAPTGTYFNELEPDKALPQAYDLAARAKLRALSERLGRSRRRGPASGFNEGAPSRRGIRQRSPARSGSAPA
jgi:NAD(P)-dependent dehydrogenase (short-subunit alcohol dehydrogenase family)